MNMILLALTLVGTTSAEEQLLAQVSAHAPVLRSAHPHMNLGALNRMFDAQPLRKELQHRVPEQDLVVDVPEPPKEYRRTFRVLMNNPEKTDRYDQLIIDQADKHGLDPRLVKSIIAAESEFTIQARSPKGARGLMQVMPKTAAQHGVPPAELYSAEGSVQAGTSYLAWLFKTAWKRWKLKGVAYRDAPMWILQRIIAAYNAGPRFLTKRPWYKETKHYVRKVVMYYKSKVSDLRRPPENRYAYPKVTMAPSSAGMLF